MSLAIRRGRGSGESSKPYGELHSTSTSLLRVHVGPESQYLINRYTPHVHGTRMKPLLSFHLSPTLWLYLLAKQVEFGSCGTPLRCLSMQTFSHCASVIHLVVDIPSCNSPLNMTAMYNYPNPALQNQVWGILRDVYNSITGSWLVFEDFNSILKQSGVGQLLGHACMGFLLSCRTAILWIWASRVHVLHGLIIRKNHFHIREKSFPKTKKIHLTNSTSDHSPILLDTDPTCMHKSSRFIYDNRWSVHNSYHELVKKYLEP